MRFSEAVKQYSEAKVARGKSPNVNARELTKIRQLYKEGAFNEPKARVQEARNVGKTRMTESQTRQYDKLLGEFRNYKESKGLGRGVSTQQKKLIEKTILMGTLTKPMHLEDPEDRRMNESISRRGRRMSEATFMNDFDVDYLESREGKELENACRRNDLEFSVGREVNSGYKEVSISGELSDLLNVLKKFELDELENLDLIDGEVTFCNDFDIDWINSREFDAFKAKCEDLNLSCKVGKEYNPGYKEVCVKGPVSDIVSVLKKFDLYTEENLDCFQESAKRGRRMSEATFMNDFDVDWIESREGKDFKHACLMNNLGYKVGREVNSGYKEIYVTGPKKDIVKVLRQFDLDEIENLDLIEESTSRKSRAIERVADEAAKQIFEARVALRRAKRALRENDMQGFDQNMDTAGEVVDAVDGMNAEVQLPPEITSAIQGVKTAIDDLVVKAGIEPAVDMGADEAAGVPAVDGMADPNAAPVDPNAAPAPVMESVKRRLAKREALLRAIKEGAGDEVINSIIDSVTIPYEFYDIDKKDSESLVKPTTAKSKEAGDTWPTKKVDTKNIVKESKTEQMITNKINESKNNWDWNRILKEGILG